MIDSGLASVGFHMEELAAVRNLLRQHVERGTTATFARCSSHSTSGRGFERSRVP